MVDREKEKVRREEERERGGIINLIEKLKYEVIDCFRERERERERL